MISKHDVDHPASEVCLKCSTYWQTCNNRPPVRPNSASSSTWSISHISELRPPRLKDHLVIFMAFSYPTFHCISCPTNWEHLRHFTDRKHTPQINTHPPFSIIFSMLTYMLKYHLFECAPCQRVITLAEIHLGYIIRQTNSTQKLDQYIIS